ncbi:helix-turn-helix transcriptional regulator [Clostridium sp. MB05]|jgi:transcriptional regulator with XRE-family HTH domain|uniref:helix-turn-helix transcriptional regulator n=2 Tax=Clostridium TaxID=1485 RepID=UPI003981E5A2
MSNKLGFKIKQLRSKLSLKEGKKFTQSDLAKALNISRSYLGDIESGRTLPNNILLTKIADFFNIEIIELTNLISKDEDFENTIDINQLEKSLLNSDLTMLINNILKLNDNMSLKLIRDNIEELSEYEELEFKKLNKIPIDNFSIESNTIKTNFVNSYYDLLTKKILLLFDLERKNSEKLLEFKRNINIKNNFIDSSSPMAAHDKDGSFTKEDYIHDENIMDNDDFWNN